MPTNWIDFGVVAIIIIFAVAIFYRALQEPLNLLGRLIKGMIGSARDKIVDTGESGTERIIHYG